MYGEVALLLHAFVTSEIDGELHIVITHQWGKKPHDPLVQWILETGQKSLCSWELNCWFSTCSAGGLAIVLTGQFYVSVRYARGINPEQRLYALT